MLLKNPLLCTVDVAITVMSDMGGYTPGMAMANIGSEGTTIMARDATHKSVSYPSYSYGYNPI